MLRLGDNYDLTLKKQKNLISNEDANALLRPFLDRNKSHQDF